MANGIRTLAQWKLYAFIYTKYVFTHNFFLL